MIHIFTDNITDNHVRIEGEALNHLRNVLRVEKGDDILVSDGSGHDYTACISTIGADFIEADIIGTQTPRELPVDITLYQALPKGDKLELIIQKSVELGVARIVPIATSRCVVKLDDKTARKKTERWQKIAQSASEQSQRGRIPEVSLPMTWKEALKDAANHRRNVIPYELENENVALRQLLEDARTGQIDSLGIFIGPEGGFTEDEIASATAAGIIPITLGRRILRTETAGMALIAAVMLEIESAVN